MLRVLLRCLNDLLSPYSTVLWSLPPTLTYVNAYRRVLSLVFLNPYGQMSISLSKIGGITSTSRQFVDHIGCQITREWRLKGGKGGYRFPGAKHNLYVGDAARLVCKHLTLISSILKHEHWRFLVSLVIGCPSFCLIFTVHRWRC